MLIKQEQMLPAKRARTGELAAVKYGLVCSTSPFLVFTKLEAELSKTQAGRENRPNCHLHMQL